MKLAVILGGASCLWDYLDSLRNLAGGEWPGIVIATNMAGVYYQGRIDHYASRHPENMFIGGHPTPQSPPWIEQRRARGGNTEYTTWSHIEDHPAARAARIAPDWGGGSGLLAITAALQVECTRIVLCGMPLDRRAHFHVRDTWDAANSFQKDWTKKMSVLKPRVRSFSGWTAEQFGKPTAAWLGLTRVSA